MWWYTCENDPRWTEAVYRTIEICFTTIEYRDEELEREIRNLLKLNIQNYTPITKVGSSEEFITLDKTNKIKSALDIKKAPAPNK